VTQLLEQWIYTLTTGIVVLAVLYAVLTRTGHKAVLWAMLAVALLTGGLVAASLLIETPREEVRATLDRLAAAIESDRPEDALRFIPTDAPLESMRQQAKLHLERYRAKEFNIRCRLENIEIDSDGYVPVAYCDTRIWARGGRRSLGQLEMSGMIPVRLTLEKRQQGWMLVDYEVLSARDIVEGFRGES